MKVAIMTQPLGKNYGGMMQAFALQKVLEGMGHEVVTIDRQLRSTGVHHNTLRKLYRLIKKVTGKRKAPINLEAHFSHIFKSGYSFVANTMRMSECIYSTDELKKHFIANSYEAVVVGSDQTWRPLYSPDIFNFYLDFLSGDEIRKVAYASSFGVDHWEYSESETLRCALLAKEFDAISVRETSGVDLCNEYLGVESTPVLDPTLLHDKSVYLELIGDRFRDDGGDGVYTYWLDPTGKKNDFSRHLANKINTQAYKCQANYGPNDIDGGSLEDYEMPPVADWLAGFANAKFVLTDSFHGMVFSILFNKPFYCIVNHERGSARFNSLVRMLGISDRLIDLGTCNYSELPICLDEVDYEKKIQAIKESSMLFLTQALR